MQTAYNAGAIALNTTYYFPLCNAGFSSTSIQTIEALAVIPFRRTGKFTNLTVRIASNTTSGGGILSLRVNGATTALSVTIPAGSGATTITDALNSYTILSGDSVCGILILAAGSGTITVAAVTVCFEDTNVSTTTWHAVTSPMSYLTDSTDFYFGLAGDPVAANTVLANAYNYIGAATTFLGMYAYVSSNARITKTLLSLYKNGADTGITITIPIGGTGPIESTGTTVSVSPGDAVCWHLQTSTGGGKIIIPVISTSITTTATNTYQSFYGAAQSTAGTTTQFLPVGGRTLASITGGTGRTNASMPMFHKGRLSKFYMYVRANTTGNPLISTAQIAGADSTLGTTEAAGFTGLTQDTTDQASFGISDLLNLSINGSGEIFGGNVNVASASLLFEVVTTAVKDPVIGPGLIAYAR